MIRNKILCCCFLVFFCITGILAQKNASFSARQISRVPFSTFSGGIVVIRAQLAGYPDKVRVVVFRPRTGNTELTIKVKSIL